MTEHQVNCKGYVLWRLGIDRVERYRSIPRVSYLLEWFNPSFQLDGAKAVAVVQGLKNVPESYRNGQVVAHMLAIEGPNWFSNRPDNDLDIEYGTVEKLLGADYLSECGTNYLLFLALKNR